MKIESAIHALTGAEVDFVIIGGWSAILHGSSYITNDLDICFSRGLDNLRRLAEALAPFHPRLRDLPANLPFVWDERTLSNGTIFTLDTDLGEIDLLAEVTGVGSFETLRASAERFEMFDRQVWALDLRSLIQSKRAAGREKDLRILPELESLLEASEPE